MKISKIFGICLGLACLSLFTTASAEAKTHVNLGFGAHIVHHHYERAPCYVEEYVAYEPVIVPSPHYSYVRIAPRPYRRPMPRSHYYEERVVVQPRPFISFGFWQ